MDDQYSYWLAIEDDLYNSNLENGRDFYFPDQEVEDDFKTKLTEDEEF